ncbi:MAG TPA: hypothetical protein VI968_00665 [archaeon]|nr:hypothetical protein [archaeon]
MGFYSERADSRAAPWAAAAIFGFVALPLITFSYLAHKDRSSYADAPKAYASGTVRTADYGEQRLLVVYPTEDRKPLVQVCDKNITKCVPLGVHLSGIAKIDRKRAHSEKDTIQKTVIDMYPKD